MTLLTGPVQVLLIHSIRAWNYHLPVIQTSGTGRCHGQGHMPGDIRGVRLQTAGPMADPKIIVLPVHNDVGKWLPRRSIQDIPGGNAWRPYIA